jgi:3',5'-cyclic AMP phosphodiesterase CpdA
MLIAQLSDLHLRPKGQLYQGLVDSNTQFALAVHALNALNPPCDLVLVSGDLVDEGTAEEYATVRQAFAAIRQPILAIPGNHDDREAFRACFAGAPHLPATGPLHVVVGHLGPVRVIGLDVTVPGEHHGALTDEAASWLQARLAEEPDRPTLVMLHQPPIESGIACIDAYSCRGGERLEAILRQHHQVERLLCGHVHRFMQQRFANTLLVTAPSTTTAIALRLDPAASPASFLEPPAFLLHHWRDGAGLVTHHVPIGPFPGPFPFF